MIKVEFHTPVTFTQYGKVRTDVYVDCNHINSLNTYSALIYTDQKDFFVVTFANIKHISAL